MDLLEYVSLGLGCSDEQVILLLESYLEEAILVYANISMANIYPANHRAFLEVKDYLRKLVRLIIALEEQPLIDRRELNRFKKCVRMLCQKIGDERFQGFLVDYIVLYDFNNVEILDFLSREMIVSSAKDLVTCEGEHRLSAGCKSDLYKIAEILTLSFSPIKRLQFYNSLTGDLIAKNILVLQSVVMAVLSFEDVYFTFGGIMQLVKSYNKLQVKKISIKGDACPVRAEKIEVAMIKYGIEFSLKLDQCRSYYLEFGRSIGC